MKHAFGILNLRHRSLLRGSVLVLGSLFYSVWTTRPSANSRASALLAIPLLLAVFGTWDTARCIRRRWSLYHAAVIVLLYTDVMALAMILFLLLYPYFQWLL